MGLLLWPVWAAVVQQGVRGTRYVAATAGSPSVVTMSIVVRAQHMWLEGGTIQAGAAV